MPRLIASLILFLPLAAVAGESQDFDQSHADFDAFLGDAVQLRGVDYADLATRRAALDRYLGELQTADTSAFSDAQKLAFWVNAYNALTLRLILDEKPAHSIMDIDGGKVWKTRTYTIAGRQVTLDSLEHTILRPMKEPRMHAAVNCASKGCPPLPPDPLTADHLDDQLDAAVERWVATNAYALGPDSLKLNVIFDWYGDDFTGPDVPAVAGANDKQAAAIHFLAPYAGKDAARLKSGELAVSWNDYDWSLNALQER